MVNGQSFQGGLKLTFDSLQMELSKKLDGKLRLTAHRSCIRHSTLLGVERGVEPYDICTFVAFSQNRGSKLT